MTVINMLQWYKNEIYALVFLEIWVISPGKDLA
jgi:hypothetical protein